jgi:excinuclease UvrABC nuclease subunit
MGKCYVYVHNSEDAVVYVGKGSGDRAWRTQNRSEKHKTWMLARLPDLAVSIVAKGLSSAEALSLERCLIEEHKPEYNRTWQPRGRRRVVSTRQLLHIRSINGAVSKRVVTPEGSFESVKAAALLLGLPYSSAQYRAQHSKKGWRYAD